MTRYAARGVEKNRTVVAELDFFTVDNNAGYIDRKIAPVGRLGWLAPARQLAYCVLLPVSKEK